MTGSTPPASDAVQVPECALSRGIEDRRARDEVDGGVFATCPFEWWPPLLGAGPDSLHRGAQRQRMIKHGR